MQWSAFICFISNLCSRNSSRLRLPGWPLLAFIHFIVMTRLRRGTFCIEFPVGRVDDFVNYTERTSAGSFIIRLD